MPPPKAPSKQITSLSQLDISKLDVKDLQNIDYQKLLKDVRQKPDTAISLVIIIIALFVSFKMFGNFQAEQKKLSAKIYEMQEKTKAVDEFTAAQVEFDNFTKSLPPKITENEFINTITDLAVKHNIQIESFSPGQNRTNPIYDMMTINLTASAGDYAEMGEFIYDIEHSGLAIRINSWNGSMGARAAGSNRRGNEKMNPDGLIINFRIDIALIAFKL